MNALPLLHRLLKLSANPATALQDAQAANLPALPVMPPAPAPKIGVRGPDLGTAQGKMQAGANTIARYGAQAGKMAPAPKMPATPWLRTDR